MRLGSKRRAVLQHDWVRRKGLHASRDEKRVARLHGESERVTTNLGGDAGRYNCEYIESVAGRGWSVFSSDGMCID